MKLDPRALPSTDEIQRSLFQTIQEKRNTIIGAVVVIALAAVAIVWFVKSKEADRNRVEGLIFEANRVADAQERVVNLESIFESVPEERKAYVLLRLGQSCWEAAQNPALPDDEARDYLERGLEALRRIERDYPEDPWALEAAIGDPNNTLVRLLIRKMQADAKWKKDHAYVHPEPDDTVTALIETNQGNIRLGFFPEHAPKHVENFIKLAKEGFYNNTLVHGVAGGVWIKMGDPNTKDRLARKTHGKGGPGYSLEPEPSRFKIRHLRGVVSTEFVGGQESGSQFMICVNPQDSFDKKRTPFGQVFEQEGMDVVEAISLERTVGQDRTLQDSDRIGLNLTLPTRKIIVHSISIWRDGKIDEGHAWDTSVVGKPRSPEDPDRPVRTGPTPEELKKLATLMGEAKALAAEGKLEEALKKVRDAIEIDAAYPGALEMATDLREQIEKK